MTVGRLMVGAVAGEGGCLGCACVEISELDLRVCDGVYCNY